MYVGEDYSKYQKRYVHKNNLGETYIFTPHNKKDYNFSDEEFNDLGRINHYQSQTLVEVRFNHKIENITSDKV